MIKSLRAKSVPKAHRVLLGLLLLASVFATRPVADSPDVAVTTYHNDLNRTGVNDAETLLTTATVNVNTFGKLFSRSVDGNIDGQPLYVPNVTTAQGVRNLVFVGTDHNTIYAFDADDPAAAAPIWSVNLGTPLPWDVVTQNGNPGYVGVRSTPVIDRATNTLFAVAETLENGLPVFRLHALDIASGLVNSNGEKFGGPYLIAGQDPIGNVAFNPYWHQQRAALLFVNNVVYVAFGSHVDQGDFRGWLFAYQVNGNTMQQVAVLNASPFATGSGIWQGGAAPAVDGNGNIYITVGNGPYDGQQSFGDSLVMLSQPGLVPQNHFTPSDQATLAAQDLDFGTQGPLLIPGANRVVTGSKDGRVFVLDTQNLGQGLASPLQSWTPGGPLWGATVFYKSHLYLGGNSFPIKSFLFNGSTFAETPSSQSSTALPGGFVNSPGLSISANGTAAGSGILWAAHTTNSAAGVLRAYDAEDLSHELWNSQQYAARDALGSWAQWAPPTVANGKVYAATAGNVLNVYGLLPLSVAVTSPLNASTYPPQGLIPLSATVVNNTANPIVRVDYYEGTNNIGTADTPPYSAPWLNAEVGNYTVTAVATDTLSNTTSSAPIVVHVSDVVSTATATAAFVKLDTTTKGSFTLAYGEDGYVMTGEPQNLPPYVDPGFHLVGDITAVTWEDPSTDPRALQRPGDGRFAKAWLNIATNDPPQPPGTFSMDVNLTDGLTHQVAVYLLDFFNAGVAEKVEIVDFDSQTVLDTQNVPAYNDGKYLVWNIKGHVLIRFTSTNSIRVAAASGIFFDPVPVPPTATFVTTDTINQGAWINHYGSLGYVQAGESNTLPVTTHFGVIDDNGPGVPLVWENHVDDPRAMQRPGSPDSDRFAKAWFKIGEDMPTPQQGSFLLALNVTDGLPHRVALYALDWMRFGITEKIEVLDATNMSILDTQNVSDFGEGKYLVWTIKGHVYFRVTSTGSIRVPAISALYIDPVPAGAPNVAPSFTRGGNETVLEDSGARNVPNWATGISAGPPSESGQALDFQITNNTNPSLFSVLPTVSPTGTLNYTPAANANGLATITLQLHDDGGIANGGDDTSDPQTFTITVTAVNDPPSFVAGGPQNAVVNSGAKVVSNWATQISAGPADESGQTLTFIVTNDNNAVFAVQPTVSNTGTLNYTPSTTTAGTAQVSVSLQDNGGGTNTSAVQIVTFTISAAANNPPSFTAGGPETVNEDSGARSVPNWATNISAGSPSESGQTLDFQITNNTNPALFAVLPTVSPTGTLNYTPAANANGVASITLRLHDNGGGTDTSPTQTFTITVNPVNDPPSFLAGVPQNVGVNSGAKVVPNWATQISAGPADESGQTLTFIVTNDNNAVFAVQPTVSNTGTLNYTPSTTTAGTAQVSVSLQDNGGGTNTSAVQIVTFTISAAANNPPSFTAGGPETVNEDSGARSVPNWATNISAGSPSESGQTLDFQITNNTNPALFAVLPTVSPTGTLNYTPAANANGVASITLRLHDNGGGTDTSPTQTFTITVNPVNDPPSFLAGAPQNVGVNSGAKVVPNWATQISAGPADESGQTLTFIVTNDNNAVFAVQPTVSNTGTLNYTPSTTTAGTAQVSVSLQDNGGGTNTSAVQIVTFTISAAANNPPSFTAGGPETVNEDSGARSVPNWATNISAGSPSEIGQALDFQITNNTNPALFAVQPTVSPAGTLNYTPAANANGVASITLRLHDNGGGTDTSPTQTFTITVNPVNDVPSFTKGPDQNVNEDLGAVTVAGWATQLSAGPSDESGQTLSFNTSNNNNALFTAQPAVAANGTLMYQPAPNASGTATVSVQIKDNGGGANGGVDTSTPQTFTITVNPVNDPPSFVKGLDQAALQSAGAQTVVGWATFISAGAPDESGQALNFIVSNNNNGLFTVQPSVAANGTLTYTPSLSGNGTAVVTVQLHDNGGGSDTSVAQTFNISVSASGANQAPSFVKGPDQSVNVNPGARVVPNWATAIAPGPQNESGQTVNFMVSNSNTGLFALQPTVSAAGTLTYIPGVNQTGSATVTVMLHDNGGTANGGVDTSAPQTFAISVISVNTAPSFTKGPDQTVNEDSGLKTVAGWATNLSAGSASESGQLLDFLVSSNNNALFAVQPAILPNGDLSFTPAANANGQATVSVRLHDNGGTANGGVDTSGIQTFTITVTPVNDPPSFVKGPNQSLNQGAPAQTVAGWASAISAGPADESGQTLTFSITNNDNAALFAVVPAIAANGTLTYTPAASANGTANITVQLQDSGGIANGGNNTSAAQTFAITITAIGINQAPSFTKGPNVSANEDGGTQTVVGWATAISAGPPSESGQTLSFLITNNTNTGLFAVQPAVSPAGTLSYSPAANANGSATVTLVLKDNGGTVNGGVDISPAQTFTITVVPVNDAPSFIKGPNQAVSSAGVAQSVPNWATALSAGPSDENSQTLTFQVSNNNNGLFTLQPAIAPNGTLTFTTLAGATGAATVTVVLKDSGGTANGGVDSSAAQTFTISANASGVNQAPSFVKGPDQTVGVNPGARVVSGWATAISPGPAEESGQTVNFIVSNNNMSLFAVQPSVSAAGTLTYIPAINATGVATVTVQLHDNGGTANGGIDTSAPQTFSIGVIAVNTVPSFTRGPDQTVLEDAGPQTVPNWVAAMSPGSAAESGQLLDFIVTNNGVGLFTTAPAIAANGTLTYTTASNAVGFATVTVKIHDNGGIANGGVDTSAEQTFLLTVGPVNDPPSFFKGPDQVTTAAAGAQTVPNWATGLSAGPANESGQTLSFLVSNNNNALFAVQPAVSPAGTLTYTPVANANGIATVTVQIQDNGGTANGGNNTSAQQTFTITIQGLASSFVTVTGGTFIYDGNAHPVTAVAGTLVGSLTNPNSVTITYGGSCSAAPVTVAQGTSCTATGTYLGDANHTGSAGSAAVTIVGAPGAVSINNMPASPILGGSFTPTYLKVGDGTASTASLTPATCTVTGGGVVGFVGAGVCTLQASVTAGTNTAPATGPQQSVTIGKAPGSVTINNLPASPVFGGSFTPAYSALGDGTPSTTSLTTGVCTVSGGVVNFIALGTCTLQASITAGTNHLAATGANQSVTVDKAPGSVSINNIPANAVFNSTFTPTYNKAGNGTASTTSLTTTVCTVSSGVVTHKAVGTCTLRASVTAGTNHLAATGPDQSYTVGKATTTISISNIPNNPRRGNNFTPNYAYIGDGVKSVASSTQTICTVSGTKVNFLLAGTCTLTASATAGTNYNAVTGSAQSFTVRN